MGRPSTFEKGLKKGPWTSEEDRKLVTYVEEHGHGSWRSLPIKAGLQRCGKSCRLRWTNYLRPDIIRGKFSLQEEETIIQLHALLGNRWSAIATHLPKRTDNEIKNFWNTNLKKRLTKTGIDPITHKSKTTVDTNLRHMTQWENARLEAEARFVRESRLVSNFYRRIHCHSPPLIKNLQAVSSSSLPQTVCLDVLKAWQGIISCKHSDEAPKDQITMPPMVNLDYENISKSSYMAPLESPLQVSDMKYQDDYLTEAFTNHTVYDANNESFCGDFEDDDKGYWSRMLDKLENNSSFPSIF